MNPAAATSSRLGWVKPSGPSGTPLCLAFKPDPVSGFLHLPQTGPGHSTAVLICPPFGWEDMCSYRGRRRWAEMLAQTGYPTARIDFPGAGDSGGGPGDPRRLEAWTEAVTGAAGWLLQSTGCARVTAIGIGLGGLVAVAAAAAGAPLDDFILWSVPARGRALLRELRVHGGVIAARNSADARPPLPEGAFESVGFLISSETGRSLEQLDLTLLALPRPRERRALLVGRDGLPVDKRLREHFEQMGVAVSVANGRDYAALMAHPQEAQTPLETIASTISWLDESPGTAAANGTRTANGTPMATGTLTASGTTMATGTPTATGMPPAIRGGRRPAVQADSMRMLVAGTAIRETPVSFKTGAGWLFGVLTEPDGGDVAPVSGVMLSAGALRQIGPNRVWVEASRRWAARGVPTLRLDLEAIGDSDGDERRLVSNAGLYTPHMTELTLGALAQLDDHGLPNRFVLAGLCSGAYWALHAALADDRVAAAMMINLYSFYWSESLVAERETRDTLAALAGSGWRRVLRRDISPAKFRQAIGGIRPAQIRIGVRRTVERSQAAEVDLALDKLRDQGTQALLMLARGEPLHGQFVREGRLDRLERWPNLSVEEIPSRDHMFRALWLQRHIHDSIDQGLDRVLGAAPAGRSIQR